MEYSDSDRKAIAAKKFIMSYYPMVDSVEISRWQSLPLLNVYFNQENKKIANEATIFRMSMIKDLKNYLGLKVISPYVFGWEKNKEEFQNPDLYMIAHSLNYEN